MERAPLDLAALHAALDARWSQVEVLAETGSTNAELLARNSGNAPDRSLLAADFQTSGRGRFDRVWSSPPRAGITASFLFRPAAPVVTWGWLPLLAGLAVAEAVRETTATETRATETRATQTTRAETTATDTTLKWPNDVLLGDLKLAGILAQSAGGAVVVGIGVNVSTAADELPPGVPATSLALAGIDADRTALLIAVAARLDARIAQWDDCGGDAAACGLAAAYRETCGTLGRKVRVTLADGGSRSGTATEVDDAGHLVLDTADGRHVIAAGDVEHLRDEAGNR